MALQRGTRLGPYQIESPIGAGGMGEVYKATDTRLERIVAIKVLPAHVASDPERKSRFEREAKTVAALSHPHICPVFDVGSEDGTDFLVMEYLVDDEQPPGTPSPGDLVGCAPSPPVDTACSSCAVEIPGAVGGNPAAAVQGRHRCRATTRPAHNHARRSRMPHRHSTGAILLVPALTSRTSRFLIADWRSSLFIRDASRRDDHVRHTLMRLAAVMRYPGALSIGQWSVVCRTSSA